MEGGILDKKGFNKEEVEEVIKFLKEEDGESGQLATFYSDLFKKAMAKIEQMSKEGKVNISEEAINELKKLNALDTLERLLETDIIEEMREYYDDPTSYGFGLKSLFLIFLSEAFKEWVRDKGIGTTNLEEIKEVLKWKGADEDTYLTALTEMLLTAGSYYDKVLYEMKAEKFLTNADEFIDARLYEIPAKIKKSDIEQHIYEISEKIYEGLRKKYDELLPPFGAIKGSLPTFTKHLREFILEARWSTYKIGVIGLVSLYVALENQLGNSDKISLIDNEIGELLSNGNREITKDDINLLKELLDYLLKTQNQQKQNRQQQLKQAERGDKRDNVTLQV
ncbi:MAG: hypothetical protein RXO35_02490 [Candidatus Micrarchaeota archaeon]